MLVSGQKVFYKESNKIWKGETKYLGVVMRLRVGNKLVVIDKNKKVIGTIRRGVRAIELTTFGGIRLEVITSW